MLKETELRPGNAILWRGGHAPDWVWIEAEFDTSDYDLLKTRSHCFKPVPITEERLLKLGFKYRKYLKDFYIKRGQQGEIIIIQNNTVYLCESNGRRKFIVRLEYMHQLQNLYFALTLKELEYAKE